jgi:transcriptional regulator with XRE-family HTH domain
MSETRKSRLGIALSTLRRERGWTLSDMSQATGFSVSTLSKVENDRISLTYDKLDQLCERLSIDISELFTPSDEAEEARSILGRRSINRVGDGQLISTPNYDYRYLSTDVVQKKFIPMIGIPRARTIQQFGELVRHSGEEFVYVIEGAIEVHTKLYAPFTLSAGESAYLDSRMGHAYLAKSDGPCRVIAICSASEAHLHETLHGDTTHAGSNGVGEQSTTPATRSEESAAPARPHATSRRASVGTSSTRPGRATKRGRRKRGSHR